MEFGGGNGTLARCVLDRLREEGDDIYSTTRYQIVEVGSRFLSSWFLGRRKIEESGNLWSSCSMCTQSALSRFPRRSFELSHCSADFGPVPNLSTARRQEGMSAPIVVQ